MRRTCVRDRSRADGPVDRAIRGRHRLAVSAASGFGFRRFPRKRVRAGGRRLGRSTLSMLGYLVLTALFAVLVLSVKEDQAIFLGIAAIAGAVAYRNDVRRRTLALFVVALCVVVFVAFFAVIQPHAAAVQRWRPERFYAWTSQDWRALLGAGVLTRLGFLVAIFAPLAFLPFRSRVTWLAFAPLAEVLASRMSTTYTLGTHYAGAWIGYVLIGFAGAVAAAGAGVRRWLWWAAALAAIELLVANPLHPGLNLRAPQPRDVILDAAVAELPRYASVATQEEAYAHLALDDPLARLLPEKPDVDTRACFVVIDRDFPQSARLQEYGPRLDALVRAGVYVPIARSAGVEIVPPGRCVPLVFAEQFAQRRPDARRPIRVAAHDSVRRCPRVPSRGL